MEDLGLIGFYFFVVKGVIWLVIVYFINKDVLQESGWIDWYKQKISSIIIPAKRDRLNR